MLELNTEQCIENTVQAGGGQGNGESGGVSLRIEIVVKIYLPSTKKTAHALRILNKKGLVANQIGIKGFVFHFDPRETEFS
jgi:hypothetical protein